MVAECSTVVWCIKVFFYSSSIFINAKIQTDSIPFAVMGVNAVNVAMTVIAVRSLPYTPLGLSVASLFVVAEFRKNTA